MNGAKGNNVLPLFTLAAHGKSRANFTEYHLLAAQNAYESALKVENSIKETNSADELKTYIAHVSTCVMCSVAALESKINEYTIDNKDRIDKLTITKQYRNSLNCTTSNQILNDTCIVDKYERLWLLACNCELPENKLKQDIGYLAKLRNALTHFTPEWTGELNKHAKLEKALNNRFPTSPFYPDPACLFFPYRCLSAGCAEWSIRTSQDALRLFPCLR